MSTRLATILELKSLFMKTAFLQVPPHPDFQQPQGQPQGPPPGDPAAQGQPQGMPAGAPAPQGQPPADPAAMAGPAGQDPNAQPPSQPIDPAQLMPLLESLTGKMEEVAKQNAETNARTQQELAQLRHEMEKDQQVRAARREAIEAALPSM